MRIRRILAVAMTVVTVAGSLAGCGNKAASKDGAVDSSAYEGATLNVHFHSNNMYTIADADGNLLPVYKFASDQTKINIKNVANQVATNSSQEFQLQATQQFPADIYGGTDLRQSINSFGVQGAFLPLEELIDTYAPNIKKFLDDNADIKKSMTAADGHIYSLDYSPDGDVGRCYFIRQDWLDKLNLKQPTNLTEMETVLYAFKNNDPNSNGKKDEIPVFNDKWQEIVRLANFWGARVFGFDSFAERVVLDNNDKFYQAWVAPEFKTALKGLAKWYSDGIIDPETFSRKVNTARATLWTKENTGGMTNDFPASTSLFNYNPELLASTPAFKLTPILPVGQNGPTFVEHHRALVKNDGWAISAKTTNKIAAIKFMDWFYSNEGKQAANFGVEGLTYDIVNGEPKFKDTVLSQANVLSYLQKSIGAQLPIGYKQTFAYEKQWTSKIGQDAFDLYTAKANYAKQTPTLSFNESEQDIFDTYLTNLNTYQDEMITGFITGKYNVDTGWDAYVAKCKELGSDKLVKIYQLAYDRYTKVK